jgi:hypothetical protein
VARARSQPRRGYAPGTRQLERFVRSWLESFDSFRVEPERVAAGAPGPRLANDGDEIVIRLEREQKGRTPRTLAALTRRARERPTGPLRRGPSSKIIAVR